MRPALPPSLLRLVDKLLVAPAVVLAAVVRGPALGDATAATGEVVVLKLAGMGDAVLMLPALRALRAMAGGRLVVVTTARCAAVFTAPGVADRVIVMGGRRPLVRLRELIATMRSARAVVDFEQHVYWSSLAVMLAPRRALRHGLRSQAPLRHLAYDRLVDPGAAPRHMKEIFDDLARCAGAQPQAALVALPVTAMARQRVAGWLQHRGLREGGYRVLAPGSGASARFRRLAPAQWAGILAASGNSIPWIVAGSVHERGLLEAIERAVGQPLTLATEFNLQELACLFAGARGVIATDSGPMHLAAAAGAPVTGIFGPDTPARYRPYNERSRSLWLGLACSPCNNCFRYREARCVNPDRYACIGGIEPRQVVELAAENAADTANSNPVAG